MEQLLLLGTPLLLGFRHGIDWDHVAAISDIVSANSTGSKQRALLVSLLYACGHAFVVVVLGVAALAFAAVLPHWIDGVMERVVGATLLALGAYVAYSLYQSLANASEFRMKSRWMLLASLLQRRVLGRANELNTRGYSALAAFAIGMIHGIGAETGTQVLLIAVVGGQRQLPTALAMLASFTIGLLASNTLASVVALFGISQSVRMKPLYVGACAFTAVFSLIVGTFFVLGLSDDLPNLQLVLRF